MSITQAAGTAGKVVGGVVSGVVATTWRGATGVLGLAGQGARAVAGMAGPARPVAPHVRDDGIGPTVPEPARAPGRADARVDADPRDELPGPDVVAPAIPRPEDLPEPVVIEPAADGVGEFHTEPKPASRDSARGSTTADPEDVSGYADEVVDDAE